MKNNFIALTLVAAASISFCAQAAQDGLLSMNSSTGQYTNTLGIKSPVDRMVQVLNVKDVVVLRNAAMLVSPNSAANMIGLRDTFCVVDTAKSRVKLVFTNSRGVGNWIASTTTNTELEYRLFFGASATADLVALSGGSEVQVEAANTVAIASECGTGNVSKAVSADVNIMTANPNATYVGTVIITASPI